MISQLKALTLTMKVLCKTSFFCKINTANLKIFKNQTFSCLLAPVYLVLLNGFLSFLEIFFQNLKLNLLLVLKIKLIFQARE
jgi:hypothetical protein